MVRGGVKESGQSVVLASRGEFVMSMFTFCFLN